MGVGFVWFMGTGVGRGSIFFSSLLKAQKLAGIKGMKIFGDTLENLYDTQFALETPVDWYNPIIFQVQNLLY